jgi:hypothetical protein
LTMPRRLTTGSSSLGMVKKSHGDHCFQSVLIPNPIFFFRTTCNFS